MKLNERRNLLKNNNFTVADVFPHLMAHVKNYKKLNKNKKKSRRYDDNRHPKISLELADLIIILTNKILSTPRFKYYSKEWRDDMRSSSHLAMCRYLHNFRPNGGSCLSYLWNSIETTMIQELMRKKESEKRFAECPLDSVTEMEYIRGEPEFNVNLM